MHLLSLNTNNKLKSKNWLFLRIYVQHLLVSTKIHQWTGTKIYQEDWQIVVSSNNLFFHMQSCHLQKCLKIFSQTDQFKIIIATVGAFVKDNLDGMKCSNEFIEFILRVSREYISVIADEANKICLQEGKKTIAPYYIYQALKKYNLDSQIEELEQAKQTFSEENHVKNLRKLKNMKNISSKNERSINHQIIRENKINKQPSNFKLKQQKAQNEIYKNPEMVQQLIKIQNQLFEQSKNKTEPQKQQLNVLLSGEDYKDLADITKKSDFIGLTHTMSKESINNQTEQDEEDDDYQ